jgi:rod shape-determining protein MreD
MIRAVRILVVLYFAVLLQSVLAPSLEVFGVRPDFPFLIVLLIAFREGGAGGALAGFVSGLFVDLNSAQALGVTSLASAVVAFVVGSVADRLVGGSFVTRIIVALVATAIRDELVLLVLLPEGLLGSFGLFFRAALPGGAYTALLAAPVMALAERAVGWPREIGRAIY